MASKYPGALDALSTAGADGTVAKTAHPALHNDANDAINKIEAELGVNPSGPESTVALAIAAKDPDHGLPGFIAPTGLWPFTTTNGVASRAWFMRFVPGRTRTCKFVRFIVTTAGSASDPLDVGVYDSALNRLASSGSKSPGTNSTGVKAVEMTSSVELIAGNVYYAALAWGATLSGAPALAAASNNSGWYGDLFGTGTLANRIMLFKGASFPLPAGPVAAPEPGIGPLLAVAEA